MFLELPILSFLLETDDSGFEIQEIYQKASEIKKSNLKDLQAAIHQNFKRIFVK